MLYKVGALYCKIDALYYEVDACTVLHSYQSASALAAPHTCAFYTRLTHMSKEQCILSTTVALVVITVLMGMSRPILVRSKSKKFLKPIRC